MTKIAKNMILNKKKLTKELTNLQSKQVCEGGHGHSLDLSHVGAALAVRYLRYFRYHQN